MPANNLLSQPPVATNSGSSLPTAQRSALSIQEQQYLCSMLPAPPKKDLNKIQSVPVVSIIFWLTVSK